MADYFGFDVPPHLNEGFVDRASATAIARLLHEERTGKPLPPTATPDMLDYSPEDAVAIARILEEECEAQDNLPSEPFSQLPGVQIDMLDYNRPDAAAIERVLQEDSQFGVLSKSQVYNPDEQGEIPPFEFGSSAHARDYDANGHAAALDPSHPAWQLSQPGPSASATPSSSTNSFTPVLPPSSVGLQSMYSAAGIPEEDRLPNFPSSSRPNATNASAVSARSTAMPGHYPSNWGTSPYHRPTPISVPYTPAPFGPVLGTGQYDPAHWPPAFRPRVINQASNRDKASQGGKRSAADLDEESLEGSPEPPAKKLHIANPGDREPSPPLIESPPTASTSKAVASVARPHPPPLEMAELELAGPAPHDDAGLNFFDVRSHPESEAKEVKDKSEEPETSNEAGYIIRDDGEPDGSLNPNSELDDAASIEGFETIHREEDDDDDALSISSFDTIRDITAASSSGESDGEEQPANTKDLGDDHEASESGIESLQEISFDRQSSPSLVSEASTDFDAGSESDWSLPDDDRDEFIVIRDDPNGPRSHPHRRATCLLCNVSFEVVNDMSSVTTTAGPSTSEQPRILGTRLYCPQRHPYCADCLSDHLFSALEKASSSDSSGGVDGTPCPTCGPTEAWRFDAQEAGRVLISLE
ncbi:hypothetical protein DL93DRAFT_2088262 [Clavulina sp. PMI_390]|nr:hypothetical protein DL93DRAFT_2088262 [Clavulina sp. PMI_390]